MRRLDLAQTAVAISAGRSIAARRGRKSTTWRRNGRRHQKL